MAFGKKQVSTSKEDKLPFLKFLAWKSSDVAQAGAFLIVNTYLTLYCSDFLGISTAVVGVILLVSNILDAITDLIAAYMIDNTNTKWGKARPYEVGIIGVTICTALMFSADSAWSMGLKIAWIFFMYTFVFGIFGTMRTVANTPYMIRAFSNNRTLIGKVSSYGGLVTTLCSMVVSMSFPKLMAKMATSAAGWRTLLLIYMVPLTLVGILRFIFVKEDPNVGSADLQDKVKLSTIWDMIKKNRFGWFYFILIFIFNCVTSFGTLSYYFKYVVGDVSMTGILSIFGTLMLPLMLFFPLLLKKFSAGQIMCVSTLIGCLGYLLNFFAGANVGLLIVASLLTAFMQLPLSYLQGLIIMDLANYNETLELPRMEASVGAIFNGLGSQLGQGVGGFIMGIALSIGGYVTATGDAVVAQPDSAVLAIRLMYSLVPMALMLVLAFCAKKMGDLKKLLDNRAKETPAE